MTLKETIQAIANEQKMTLKEVSEKAGMNYNGLHNKFYRDSITVKDLEKILDVLHKRLAIVDKQQEKDTQRTPPSQ